MIRIAPYLKHNIFSNVRGANIAIDKAKITDFTKVKRFKITDFNGVELEHEEWEDRIWVTVPKLYATQETILNIYYEREVD